jgi:hypothetical protein
MHASAVNCDIGEKKRKQRRNMRHCIGKQRNRFHPSDSHLDESFETIHGPELGEEHMVQKQKASGDSPRNLGDPGC